MLTDHIGIKVRDLNISKKFYQENLDFEEVSTHENERVNILFMKNENTVIELICAKNGAYEQVPNGIVSHIAFTVPDIKYYAEKLKKNNVVFETNEPMVMANKLIIFFAGPDGERLEFVQYV